MFNKFIPVSQPSFFPLLSAFNLQNPDGALPHTFCRPAGNHPPRTMASEVVEILKNQLVIIQQLIGSSAQPFLPIIPPSPLIAHPPNHPRSCPTFKQISTAIELQLGKKAQDKKGRFSIGLWNPGPLNNAKSITAASFMEKSQLDALILCEANSRKSINQICPIKGIKLHNEQSDESGGVGVLCRTDLKHHWKILQSGSGWAVGELKIGENFRIVGLYISPRDNRSIEIFEQALLCVSSVAAEAKLILGDFNAPVGTKRRKVLSEWSKSFGFKILKTSPTHHKAGTSPSHLDLCLVPENTAGYTSVTVHEQTGFHHRLVIVTGNSEPLVKPGLRIRWNRLRNPENQVKLVAKLEAERCDGDPFEQLKWTGKQCLGSGPPKELTMLTSMQVRCKNLAASEVHDAERANIQDIKSWSKDRTAALGCGNAFWKLLIQRSRVPQDPVDVRKFFGDLYRAKNYSAKLITETEIAALVSNGSVITSLDHLFSESEVIAALLKTGRSKAPGLDGIPNLALQAGAKSQTFVKRTTALYNGLLEQQTELPKAFAILHAIPKKDNGYRPITIQDKIWQVLEVICWTRLKEQAPDLLQFENQYGFVPRKDCSNHLLNTRVFMSCRKKQRISCFLDLSKAFDTVPRPYVCSRLAEKVGSSFGRFFSLIVKMTLQPRLATVAPADSKVEILMERGVPQGSILSPWLFACVMDPLQKSVTSIPTTLRGTLSAPLAMYADDVTLYGDSLATVQAKIDLAAKDVSRWGGAFNAAKSEAISGGNLIGILTLDGEQIPFRDKGLSLGRKINCIGDSRSCDNPKASKLIGLITFRVNQGLPTRLAMEGFRAIIWGKILYGSEVFPPPVKQVTLLHSSSLRPLLGLIARRTHRCIVQREVGAAFHPIIWIHQRIIRWLRRLTLHEKSSLHGLVTWWREAFPYLADGREPSEILEDPQNHSLLIAARLKEEILNEADSQGILNLSDPAWLVSLYPKAYLTLQWAQYATLFRLPSFYSPDAGPVLCPFCMEGRDAGLHITKECSQLPKSLREERDALISESGGWQKLRLSDDKWIQGNLELAKRIILWMKTAYSERLRNGKTLHDRKLFCDVATARLIPKQRALPVPSVVSSKAEVAVPQSTHCGGCNKIFARNAHLKSHLRLHQSCPAALQSRGTPTVPQSFTQDTVTSSLFQLLDSFTNRA
jgi:hypothetical protein